ncbi:uncharacterized protein LOC123883778 [Trifolium pratense]|uniref:uncharacterized protein LOC123883778 n=1 Tax=Trifolium pratense TaxID=57577 RepID=UPI001E692739|nr:uncharacterized protein LOC123883778 [Trifolium pratense]
MKKKTIPMHCGRCQSSEHNLRTCPQPGADIQNQPVEIKSSQSAPAPQENDIPVTQQAIAPVTKHVTVSVTKQVAAAVTKQATAPVIKQAAAAVTKQATGPYTKQAAASVTKQAAAPNRKQEAAPVNQQVVAPAAKPTLGKPINITGVGLLRRPKNPVFKPVVAVKNIVVSPELVDPMKAYNNTREKTSMRFMPTPGLSRGSRNEGPST